MRNILHRTRAGYDFAVSAFPRVIQQSEQVPEWIAMCHEVLRQYGDISLEDLPQESAVQLW